MIDNPWIVKLLNLVEEKLILEPFKQQQNNDSINGGIFRQTLSCLLLSYLSIGNLY